MTTAPNTLPLLWANCVERLKDRVNNRSFWEAVESAQPIVIEDDALIIGLESANFNRASLIHQSSTWNIVLGTVEEVFGKRLTVRVIEGVSPADWAAAKDRDRQVNAAKLAAESRHIDAARENDSWDAILEYVSRLYTTAPLRSFPQGKARYANEALYTLVEAMDTLYVEPVDEQADRSLARVLDRIANASEIPAPVLAFELERLRAWRRPEAEQPDA